MSVFADYLDLRTAVIEMIGNADIADVFPRLVKMAEGDFNRRLRCREQMTTASITVASGTYTLPTDLVEIIGLFDTSGRECVQMPRQSYEMLTSKNYFYSIDGLTLLASDADYSLQYYAKVPTITDSMSSTNWLLEKQPELYLYAVANKAAKHIANPDLAGQTMSLAESEFAAVAGQDYAERFARARVRVAGMTP